MGWATSSSPTRWSRRLVVQFLAPTLVALAGVVAVALPYIASTVTRHRVDALVERLLAEAREVGDALPWSDGAALDAACRHAAENLRARVTVIAAEGRVLGESDRSSETLENHASRPEFQGALATGEGHAIRHSTTLDRDLIYAAVRQERDGARRIVRVAAPLGPVETDIAHVERSIGAALLGGIVLGLAGAVLLSRRMVRRIQRLVAFARRLAAGEPPSYIGPEVADDLGVLEAQLGEMARNVTATIGALRVEQDRLEAILRGMVEGVIVADLAGTVVLLNARARALLGVSPDLDPRGRPLVELVREPAFAELPRELGAGRAIVSRDVVVGAVAPRTLQVNAATIRAADGHAFGIVIVLHDVTELRRLEVIRRDFVANVSHELRTPLTAIKGYAETLLGPAGDDRETARKFLAVIDRHSERLGRLIDDLLVLSDLELGRTPIRFGAVQIGPVVDDVLQILSERIRRAEVEVEARVVPGTPAVLADGDRLRQVLINLVDNAIKYTAAGGRVAIHAAVAAGLSGTVELRVQDTGVGIPAPDLPRLTERFFRVDKARSRELGGTGLGLAIVKHIVQAHGGSLAIESVYGEGTTIRILWPAAAAPAETAPAAASA